MFQDSGWYNTNLSAADPLIPGVHWGYKQGCNFATAKCVDGGTPVSSLLFRIACHLISAFMPLQSLSHLSIMAPRFLLTSAAVQQMYRVRWTGNPFWVATFSFWIQFRQCTSTRLTTAWAVWPRLTTAHTMPCVT